MEGCLILPSFLCAKQYLSTLQGLPGPPGEKGENGDVGPMVSADISANFLLQYNLYTQFHSRELFVGPFLLVG